MNVLINFVTYFSIVHTSSRLKGVQLIATLKVVFRLSAYSEVIEAFL